MAAMAERDPFGRLPDENPLAGLGSLSDGTHGEAAVVATDVAPGAVDLPTPTLPWPPSGSSRDARGPDRIRTSTIMTSGRVVALVVRLVAVAIVIAIGAT